MAKVMTALERGTWRFIRLYDTGRRERKYGGFQRQKCKGTGKRETESIQDKEEFMSGIKTRSEYGLKFRPVKGLLLRLVCVNSF